MAASSPCRSPTPPPFGGSRGNNLRGGTGERGSGMAEGEEAMAKEFGDDDVILCNSSAICSCSFSLLFGRGLHREVFGGDTQIMLSVAIDTIKGLAIQVKVFRESTH
jgi:hypothetical protein